MTRILQKLGIKKQKNKREFSGAMVLTDEYGNEQVVSFRQKIKLEIYGDIETNQWRLPNQSFIERFGSKRDIEIEKDIML